MAMLLPGQPIDHFASGVLGWVRLSPRWRSPEGSWTPRLATFGLRAVAIGDTPFTVFAGAVQHSMLARGLLKISASGVVGQHRQIYGGHNHGSAVTLEAVSRARTDRTPMGLAVSALRGVRGSFRRKLRSRHRELRKGRKPGGSC